MFSISEIMPNLYLGSAKHFTRQTDEFKNLGIDVIINCCCEYTHKPNPDFIIENYPIRDGFDATITEYLDPVTDKIKYYLDQNKKVYVHCVFGKSRSPSIIIYYLMKYQHKTFDEAYKYVMSKRPIISINMNFLKELRAGGTRLG